MKKGFTLIELLVVVLIIGILSAVALPQYQKAVLKARFAGAIPIAKSIKDNMAIFHLAENRYPTSAEFPDMVDFGDKTCEQYRCRVGDYVVYYSSTFPYVQVLYSPGNTLNVTENNVIGAGVFARESTNNVLTMACVASGTKPNQVCSVYPSEKWTAAATNFTGGSFYRM